MAKRLSQQAPLLPESVPSSEMFLRIPAFSKIPWLVHGFTTRRGGVSDFSLTGDDGRSHSGELNLGKVAWDSAPNVLENRRRMKAALGVEEMKLITLRQVHADSIRIVDSGTPRIGDALMTRRTGTLLSILAADCIPILMIDTRQRIVAAVHCGWRGTVKRLAGKTVARMQSQYGSKPQDIRAAIGPGIRVCCYQVGVEVYEQFRAEFGETSKIALKRPGRATATNHYLDLTEANRVQLEQAGILQKHIHSAAPCTSCHPELFFSHRRDAGRTGRMMGVIGIRSDVE